MIKLNDIQIKLAEQLLLSVVKRERFVEYGELAQRIDPPIFHRQVGYHIGEISKLCYELGLPFISAKVTNKGTKLAGEGFFSLYDFFGIDKKNMTEDELYQRELKLISECTEWHKLAEYLGLNICITQPILPSVIAEELPKNYLKELPEGAKQRITVNKYERNAYYRKQCIEHYKMLNNGKVSCQICNFNFSEVYGIQFENRIHIHHKIPLHMIEKANYIVNPIRDLIPVCPNCHLILHCKEDGGVYDVEEVKEFIETKKG